MTPPAGGDTPKPHAPKGPIKVKHLLDAPYLMDVLPTQCRARSKRSGQQCKRHPIPGGTVCHIHGGKAPHVQAKADERLRAFQHPALDGLAELIDQREFPSVRYAACKDVLDRTLGKAPESVDLHVSGSLDLVGRLQAARKRLADVDKDDDGGR
jgi:hypothetical protein